MSDLNARLLEAHDRGDKRALVVLYTEAADQASDVDSTCFFLTQAYVFALDVGHQDTDSLKGRLVKHGRL